MFFFTHRINLLLEIIRLIYSLCICYIFLCVSSPTNYTFYILSFSIILFSLFSFVPVPRSVQLNAVFNADHLFYFYLDDLSIFS